MTGLPTERPLYLELSRQELATLYGLLVSNLRAVAYGPQLASLSSLAKEALLQGTTHALSILGKIREMQPDLPEPDELLALLERLMSLPLS